MLNIFNNLFMSFIDHQPTSQWQRRPECNNSTISFLFNLWFWFWSNLPDKSNEVQLTVESDDRHTPCANSTALERLLQLHSRNTCQRRTMLKICLHWRQEDFLQTRVSKPTLEMHIWPTLGLWERSNRAKHSVLKQREMRRRLPNGCSRSLASARLRYTSRTPKRKFKLILTRRNSNLRFSNRSRSPRYTPALQKTHRKHKCKKKNKTSAADAFERRCSFSLDTN